MYFSLQTRNGSTLLMSVQLRFDIIRIVVVIVKETEKNLRKDIIVF